MKYFDRLLVLPSKENFARVIMRELKASGDNRKATFDADAFQLNFHDQYDLVGQVNLGNLYEEFLAKPLKSRRAFLRNTVRSLLAYHKAPPDDFEAASHDLLLSLRSRAYFSLTEMQSWIDGHHDFAWPHSPIANYLGVGIVYDLPEAMIMLQQEQLDAWDISYYEAVEAAQANLSELEADFASIDNHVYVSATEDQYDASRLLIPDLVRELAVRGDTVAMVPNRDCLIITGTEEFEGIELMSTFARDALKRPRPLSGMAFSLQGDEWSPWLPPIEHPAAEIFAALRIESDERDYADQRPVLQRWCQVQDDPAFVVDFGIGQGQRPRQLNTHCIWPIDPPVCLLPKTERVFFDAKDSRQRRRSADLPSAPWERVQMALGDRMQEEDVFPIRYRVHDFPSPAEIADLCGHQP